MPPFTFNPCQNGNFFGSFHFGDSSCRHFVDSLSSHPLRVAASLWMAVAGFEPEFVGAAARGRPRTWMKAGETGRRGRRPLRNSAKNRRGAQTAGGASPSPTGGCEAVRFRRRGGRPRPPADVDEGRRNGTPRAPSPAGRCGITGVVRRPREGQAPPLRGGCEISGAVRFCGTSRTPSPTGWCKKQAWCVTAGG